MYIDCTTYSSIYDPTGPQGQWIQHRWGQRNYPDFSLSLEDALCACSGQPSITLNSIYGDPLCWNHIEPFLENYQGTVSIFTQGPTVSKDLLSILTKKDVSVTLEVDGLRDDCGKIFLGTQWENILALMSALGDRCTVQFWTYQHNVGQIDYLKELKKELGIEVFLRTGMENDLFGTAIIDRHCNWLYDVLAVESSGIRLEDFEPDLKNLEFDLKKHLWAYMSLRTFVSTYTNKGLLDFPMISRASYMLNREEVFQKSYEEQEGIFISPNNKKFSNHKVYSTYMLLLADDWKLSTEYLRANKNNNLVQELGYFARRLQQEYT